MSAPRGAALTRWLLGTGAALALWLLLGWLAGPDSLAQEQPPQPAPGQGQPCNPCQPGAAATNPCAPTVPNPSQTRDYSGEADPNLKYQEGVKVSVRQVENGSYPTVQAFVSVTDAGGILIRTLGEANFTVTENGTEASNVRFGNREELNLPLAIMFVVDVSGSMETAIGSEAEAIRQFVAQLEPADRIGLITFSDAAITQVPMSSDHTLLLRELDNLTPWGKTALWDGIYLGMNELLADTQSARRALIVLSDGGDNQSMETPASILNLYDEDALKQNRGFSVFTLGLGDEIDRSALGEISERTGGLYLDSPTADDLSNVYKNILAQIQNEYLLEYDSALESTPGQIIDLEVGIKGVKSFDPGKYSYRSPGLTKALARAVLPGLITICVLTLVLILLTIYKLTRRVWLTVMITPLEGRDYTVSDLGLHIGSAENCEIRVARDPAMLPIHAALSETSNGFVIEAMNSEAPLIFGSNLLAKKTLRNGDRFILGTTQFAFNERNLRPEEAQSLAAEAAPLPALSEAALAAAAAGKASIPPQHTPSLLVAKSGAHSGESFVLKQGVTTLGRADAEILLRYDSLVSRRHCSIILENNAAYVRDEGSTNGTRLNGEPCQPGIQQPVFAGDLLTIGEGSYRFE